MKKTEILKEELRKVGINSAVTWTPIGQSGGVGIEGYYAEQLHGHKYHSKEHGRIVCHDGWLGDSFNQAISTISEL